jgi:hypothetical protein
MKVRSKEYRDWIRGFVCCIGHGCEGATEAAHFDSAGGKGMATKVSDEYIIPLCYRHHRIQHQIGWSTFQREYKINALEIAEYCWRRHNEIHLGKFPD